MVSRKTVNVKAFDCRRYLRQVLHLSMRAIRRFKALQSRSTFDRSADAVSPERW